MNISDLQTIRPISDDFKRRWYPVEGTHCISITTVLGYSYPKDPQLIEWIKRMGSDGDAYRDERAAIGSRVDKGTERLDIGSTLHQKDYSRDEWKALVSYRNFVEDHDPVVLAVQSTVFDTKDKVAGTLDKIVDIAGIPHVVDIKVTSAIRPEHVIQVQTYTRLLRCMGIDIPKVGILRLGTKHKAGYEWKPDNYNEDVYEQDFLACLHLWQRAHPKAKSPYFENLPETITLPDTKR